MWLLFSIVEINYGLVIILFLALVPVALIIHHVPRAGGVLLYVAGGVIIIGAFVMLIGSYLSAHFSDTTSCYHCGAEATIFETGTYISSKGEVQRTVGLCINHRGQFPEHLSVLYDAKSKYRGAGIIWTVFLFLLMFGLFLVGLGSTKSGKRGRVRKDSYFNWYWEYH